MYDIQMITSRQMGENAYVISKSSGNECIVIDPGEKKLSSHPLLQDKKVLAILLTHGHFDHISGIEDLMSMGQIPVHIHPEDENMLYNSSDNLSKSFGIPFTVPVKAVPINKDTLTFEGFHFAVFKTPGHTKGGLCFQIENHLFTGDTLFNRSIGRMDFPGGSEEEMEASLEKLIRLPEDTVIYPGHNSTSTIKACKEYLYASGILHQ